MILDAFWNRTDQIAIKGEGWPSLTRYEVPNNKTLKKLIGSHLKGTKIVIPKNDKPGNYKKTSYRVGAYTPDVNGLTKWLCFDLDAGPLHEDGLLHPDACAKAVLSSLRKQNLKPYLEKSGGGFGWHIWVFFEEPQLARKVRLLADQIIIEIEPHLRESVKNKKEGTIEVFPKQDMPNPFGNLLWLPYWHGGVNGGCQFYDDNLNPKDVKRLQKSKLSYVPPAEKKRIATTKSAKPDGWRQTALSRLKLVDIYGDYLTGKERHSGFKECRDFRSASGDRHPSAGVYYLNDEKHERGWFYSFRTGSGMDVFQYMIETDQATNFKDAKHEVARLTDTLDLLNKETKKPEIIINNRPYEDVIKDVWDAMNRWNNPPQLFNRAGSFVRVNSYNNFVPQIVNQNTIQGILPLVANYLQMKHSREGGEFPVHCAPLQRFSKEVGEYMSRFLPKLTSITSIPIYDENLNLICEPGYHKQSGILYAPDINLRLPNKPFDAKEGLREIDKVLVDFPFQSHADKTGYLASLLLSFVRKVIKGPTPLHYIHAPTPGSGKTLLAKIVSIVLTGSVKNFIPFKGGGKYDDDEVRKKIGSALREGTPLVVFDNAKGSLESSALAYGLTNPTWSDRRLGYNENMNYPNDVVWMMTANDLVSDQEMERRLVRIGIDANTSDPHKGRLFKIKQPLPQYVTDRRGVLIWACLSIIEEWKKTGAHNGGLHLGSFESWSSVMSGILHSIGRDDLLQNAITQDLESWEDQEWNRFMGLWTKSYGNNKVKTKELLKLSEEEGCITSILGEGSNRQKKIKLGKALKSMVLRVFKTRYGQRKLRNELNNHGVNVWWLDDPRKKGG